MVGTVGSTKYYTNGTYRWTESGLEGIPGDLPAEASIVLLNGNQITRLRPSVFSHLSQCSYLYLQHNWISKVDHGAFIGLTILRDLNLANNRLTELKSRMFQELVSLTGLDLAHNEITSIESQTFHNLNKLESLNMKSNELSSLTYEMFQGLTTLSALRLNLNKIKTVDDDVLKDFSRPFALWLDGNLLHCDIRLCWLKIEIERGSIQWGTSGDKIYKPSCVDARAWSDVEWRCPEESEYHYNTVLKFCNFPLFYIYVSLS